MADVKQTSLEDVWEVLPIQTQHYKFNLEYIATAHPKGVYDKGHLFVGDLNDPCLSITFNLPGIRSLNTRFETMEISVATLNKVKNLKSCLLDSTEITETDQIKLSFSKEMLIAVIKEIKRSFPHILHLDLTDSSMMPCGLNDTLDMITYSIALYKKTWYEKEFNAYFIPRDKFISYKCKIETYATPKTKAKLSWFDFYTYVIGNYNPFALAIFKQKYDEYEAMYDSSKTFPDFFIALSRTIPRADKCKFFKDWLELFITRKMDIPSERYWYIDLYPVQTGGKYMRKTRTKTRRRR
jgi:hypothetical protein